MHWIYRWNEDHRFWLSMTGLLLLLYLGYVLLPATSLNLGGDAAGYLLHARNLAEGQPYADTGYVRNPHYYFAPEVYPPGLPLLLAPVIAGFGLNALAIKMVMSLFLVGLLGAVVLLLRGVLPPLYLAGLVLLLGLHPYFWDFRQITLSDIPFATFTILSLAVYSRATSAQGRSRIGWGGLAGVLAGYATATRLIGGVIFPCFLIYDLLRFHRPTKAFLGASLIPMGGLVAAVMVGPSTGAPVGETLSEYAFLFWNDLVPRLGQLPHHLPERLFTMAYGTYKVLRIDAVATEGVGEFLYQGLFVAASFLALLGFSVRTVRHRGMPEIFSVVYGLALVPWSFIELRYLIPLIALFFFYVLVGVRLVRQHLPVRHPGILFVALLIIGVGYGSHYVQHGLRSPPETPSSMTSPAAHDFYDYLRTASPDSTFLTGVFPRTLTLFTDRRATMIHAAPDTQLVRDLHRLGVTHVVVGPAFKRDDPNSAVYRLLGVTMRHPGWFERVFWNREFVLYRIRPSALPARSEDS
jgi:hypothetical protein